MGRLLATSDIHGCYDEFINLIYKIELTKEDTLVILGDLIDRGIQNMKVILKIQELKQKGYNIITLKGNHEDMFLYGIKTYRSIEHLQYTNDYRILFKNGTVESMVEYYELTDEEKGIVNLELSTQKFFHKEKNHLFVHAGVVPNVNFGEQAVDDLLWVREEFMAGPHNLPYVVVFGHTPTAYLNSNKELKIYYGEDRIGIDCGCVFGGKLACLEILEDGYKEHYVDGFKNN